MTAIELITYLSSVPPSTPIHIRYEVVDHERGSDIYEEPVTCARNDIDGAKPPNDIVMLCTDGGEW